MCYILITPISFVSFVSVYRGRRNKRNGMSIEAQQKKEGDYMTDKQYPVCPIMKNACITGCMWFKDGECCIASLPDLVDKLEDVVTSVEALEQTVKNKDFQM